MDGCAELYIPFTRANQTQFFTGSIGSADLSGSIITAQVRVTELGATGTYIKLYASDANYTYFGGSESPQASTLVNGGTLTLDLRNSAGGDWDPTGVITYGFHLANAGVVGVVRVEIEEVRISDAPVGPWLFTSGFAPLSVNDYESASDPGSRPTGSAVRWIAPAAQ